MRRERLIVEGAGGTGAAGEGGAIMSTMWATTTAVSTTVEPADRTAVVCKDGRAGKAGNQSVRRQESCSLYRSVLIRSICNWLENIRDWCISRQLWWGHRIPAYYCDKCGEMVVAKDSAGSLSEMRHVSI